MPIYKVKVITNASKNKILFFNDESIKIYTTASPKKGKANKSIIKMLSKHFLAHKSDIKIISGELSSNKTIETI